jgi:pyrroline-5-carboxylate reductase
VSGSGSANYFLMIEEMIRAGTSLGLSPEDAKVLTLQTAFGAATMAAKGDATAALIAGVTSPKRTTHATIISMPENGIGDVIVKK